MEDEVWFNRYDDKLAEAAIIRFYSVDSCLQTVYGNNGFDYVVDYISINEVCDNHKY